MDRTRLMKGRRLVIIGIKYALASAVALWASRFLNLPDRLSCVFVTLLILQPNLLRGLRTSWDQFKATIVATVVTAGSVMLIQPSLQIRVSVIQMALTLGVTMIFLMNLNLIKNTPVALFTVTYLSTLPSMVNQSFWATVHIRFGSIVLGIAVGTAFNFLSSRFRYRDRFYLSIRSLSERIAARMESWCQPMGGISVPPNGAPLESNLETIEQEHRSLRSDLEEVDWEFRYLHPLMGAKEKDIHRIRQQLVDELEVLIHLLRSLTVFSGDTDESSLRLRESERHRMTSITQRFREAVKRLRESPAGSIEATRPEAKTCIAGWKDTVRNREGDANWMLSQMENAVEEYRFHVEKILTRET